MRTVISAAGLSVMLAGAVYAQTASPSSAQKAQTSPPQTAQQPAQSGSPAASPGIRTMGVGSLTTRFYVVAPADVLATRLIGLDVHNLQNEEVGEIEDLVLDNGKQVRAVIVSVGGFLGLAERYVAVQPGSLIIAPEADDGSLKAVVNTTREQLKVAPEFKFDGNMARNTARNR